LVFRSSSIQLIFCLPMFCVQVQITKYTQLHCSHAACLHSRTTWSLLLSEYREADVSKCGSRGISSDICMEKFPFRVSSRSPAVLTDFFFSWLFQVC
jgi:hypothetical protein